jgi:hypothetical protein
MAALMTLLGAALIVYLYGLCVAVKFAAGILGGPYVDY